MTNPVSLHLEDGLARIELNSPPVNALGYEVRKGLLEALNQALEREARAIVLHGAGKVFSAGADIHEFGQPARNPWLPEVLDRIEACSIPVIAAIHGVALGGGLELANAAHYRIAAPGSKLGLPEVKLGILPGAGGTQRSPRLMGVQAALDLMVSGKPISAEQAVASGLVDRLSGENLLDDALAWAAELAESGVDPRRTSRLPIDTSTLPDGFFAEARESVRQKTRGLPAPLAIVDCVEKATELDFEAGSKFERKAFMKLVQTPESAALRHAFFAERQAAKIDGLPEGLELGAVQSIGVIGAGTMGGGIAMSFANAGIPVTVLELDQAALDRGLGVCQKNYEYSVKRGRFSAEQADRFMSLIRGTTDYADLAQVDLVIEAVFEDPTIKSEVFRKLDQVCKPGAILASNTSYQNIDDIAAVTSRPADVLGMHFFSPANVMKLLEVVRGAETSDTVIATVMKLAQRIRKVPVLARVCYGFIGNRMLEGYFRESLVLLLEGAAPAEVDSALEAFGMAMGPIAVGDLAGWDVGYKARHALPEPPDHPAYTVTDQLVEMGRLGQKTGKGFYQYDPQTRRRQDDEDVEQLIRAQAAALGIEQRSFTPEEIVERVIYPLINEGARVLEEGIAQRSSDIDVIYLYGYGFPAHRGGPMFYADQVGADVIYRRICAFRDSLGRPGDWQPAPLLQELAGSGRSFSA